MAHIYKFPMPCMHKINERIRRAFRKYSRKGKAMLDGTFLHSTPSNPTKVSKQER